MSPNSLQDRVKHPEVQGQNGVNLTVHRPTGESGFQAAHPALESVRSGLRSILPVCPFEAKKIKGKPKNIVLEVRPGQRAGPVVGASLS